MWLLILSVLTLITLLCYWISTRNLNYWKVRNVVGPAPVPLFGNVKENVFRRRHVSLIWKDVYNQYRNEKVIGIFRMTNPNLIISDLDLIKDVMIKNFDAFADRGIEFGGLGENLFDANEETWRLLRNRFSPMFTSGKLKNMFHLLDERSDDFFDYLNVKSNIVEYEIKSILQKYTISTISACAFGVDIDIRDDKTMKQLYMFDEHLFKNSYFLEIDLLFPGIFKKLNMSFLPAEVDKFFYDIVRKVFAERKGIPSGRKDFMDLIMELMKTGEVQSKDGTNKTLKITESVTAAQAFVFYAAGYETSATTMTYLLYELAKHQSIQDKVIKEIDDVTKGYEGKITYDALQEMTYLNRVFDETLRVYPIVDTLQRCAKTNYVLPETNVTVKKGQIVLIPVLGIHHDERYYPNPEIFDPDRFLPENIHNRHPCSYLPFGNGPRNCIGMRFGKLQSLLCIAKLLSKYRVEPSLRTPKKIQINPYRLVYSPKEDMFLNFVRRDK